AYYRRSDLPVNLHWVIEKASYIIIRHSTSIIVEGAFVAALCGGNLFLIVLMLVQTLYEIHNGITNSSAATRKYQERAVTALKLQGIVPSTVYGIPIAYIFAAYLYAYFIAGFESTSHDPILGTLSAFSLIPMNWHTFVHSLTIL
ncbi:hypothetical protein PMAYCL1PPCAC_19671, partial [Pristionchus mayeri]